MKSARFLAPTNNLRFLAYSSARSGRILSRLSLISFRRFSFSFLASSSILLASWFASLSSDSCPFSPLGWFSPSWLPSGLFGLLSTGLFGLLPSGLFSPAPCLALSSASNLARSSASNLARSSASSLARSSSSCLPRASASAFIPCIHFNLSPYSRELSPF